MFRALCGVIRRCAARREFIAHGHARRFLRRRRRRRRRRLHQLPSLQKHACSANTALYSLLAQLEFLSR